MIEAKVFRGASVFLSRNLVPPEIFDTLHDALKHNGAEVFLCCDPSRNGPNDYHVISSADHEKFDDLRAKGCKLIGPQCVLSSANERRPLPQRGFTCCLAMDGVKVLASGFKADEKAKIEKLVAAMGGVLLTKASAEVNFVIVKNVLAAKYQWALNILKKQVLTVSWLYQCWNEHRIVPQESHRILPFSGLTVSVSGIPADKRKEIEKLLVQNGGKYSADLTKKCTHLICNAPEGDKYKVARAWGHINIVTQKWFDQSIARRACLNEESFPVGGGSESSTKIVRGGLMSQQSLLKSSGNLQSAPSSVAADSNFSEISFPGSVDPDLEATLSQDAATLSDASVLREGNCEVPATMPKHDTCSEACVANDSQSEDDLYLSACRILLVGFRTSDMRKLVGMVRNGGGSRYMIFNDKLTHIVVGSPSEMEKKEIRDISASGIIHVVRATWLEDCDREKKESLVLGRHLAHDTIIPKGSNNGASKLCVPSYQVGENISLGSLTPSLAEENTDEKQEVNISGKDTLDNRTRFSHPSHTHVMPSLNKDQQKAAPISATPNSKSSCVFKGKIFQFSDSFQKDRRAEVIQWVSQGGGEVVTVVDDDHMKRHVHFTIEGHGVLPRCVDVARTTHVSTHWIRSCLEDGSLLDISSHILYSPLPCCIPLAGFEKFRFCISQYEEKSRVLLRNLCFVLGAKFVEKLTRKVTHLICKFTDGPKYEAACKWGIHSITAEWIYECVRQNKVVQMDSYRPKEVTAEDREAGLCTMSQFPTQAVRMLSGNSLSHFPRQSQELRDEPRGTAESNVRRDDGQSRFSNKKARLLHEGDQKGQLPSEKSLIDSLSSMKSSGSNTSKSSAEASHAVPDVAAAIEDLLEQTSKIHDQSSPGSTGCEKSIYLPDCSTPEQGRRDAPSVVGLSKHWYNRTDRKDDISNPSADRNTGLYDGFSETQTESQVVVYEEDLSGRQMLIDRVRTRSSSMT